MTNRDIDPTKAIVGKIDGYVVAIDMDGDDETVWRYLKNGYSVELMDIKEAMRRREFWERSSAALRSVVQQNESEATK